MGPRTQMLHKWDGCMDTNFNGIRDDLSLDNNKLAIIIIIVYSV